MSPFSR